MELSWTCTGQPRNLLKSDTVKCEITINFNFEGIMSDNITISFSHAEIKELDTAAYMAIRRMLQEGISSAERNDDSVRALVSAITKIHEQALGGADTPRMQDIRQMIAASDVL